MEKSAQFTGGTLSGIESNGGVSAMPAENQFCAARSGLFPLSVSPAFLFGCVNVFCGVNIAALTVGNRVNGGQL